MRLNVHLHTILQRESSAGPINHLEVELPAGSNIGDLLERLEIKMDPDAILLVVNGRMTDTSHILQDEDTVNLMPALSGG